MSGGSEGSGQSDRYSQDRQNLLNRLLDAVKQCQVRFGGRSELATDTDSRISCLCATWETALQHGLKHTNKALSTLKQVTEITGLTKAANVGLISNIRNMETEPVFWDYVRKCLSKHELMRYQVLKNVTTDAGRGRAWLRSTFNEQSLEKYLHMLLEDHDLLKQYYEDWAFLRDQERSSMLPMMAAGLGSILFAINIDNEDLNAIKPASGIGSLITSQSDSALYPRAEPDIRPVIAGDSLPDEKKKERKRKKKVAKLVSFDDEQLSSYSASPSSSVASPLLPPNSTVLEPVYTSSDENQPVTVTAGVQKESQTMSSDGAPRSKYTTNNTQVDTFSKQSPDGSSINDGAVEFDIYTSEDNLSVDSAPFEGNGLRKSPTSSVTSGFRIIEQTNNGKEEQAGDIMVPVQTEGLTDSESLSSNMEAQKEREKSPGIDTFAGTQNAAYALQMAQKGLLQSNNMRTQGDGGPDTQAPRSPVQETMTSGELRQAVVAMMLRKDEVEEQNSMLKGVLEQEQERSCAFKLELEEMKSSHLARQEQDHERLKALTRENDLLKHQLKKYVSAVQMLRSQGANVKDTDLSGIHVEEPQPTIPEPKPTIDYSYEVNEYEKKLVQVAEMHGELMEFNEIILRQLNAKESLVNRLNQELVILRGPLPQDLQGIEGASGGHGLESGPLGQALVSLWIPSAFLKGTGSESFHVYQIYIRVKDEEWTLYRRYTQFRDLHQRLKKHNPIVSTFDFPPKKTIGNKNTKFVDERRQKLQTYMRKVLNFLLTSTDTAINNKEMLLQTFPFLGDISTGKGKKMKARKKGKTESETQES